MSIRSDEVAFKKLHEGAMVPTYGTESAIGLDLYADLISTNGTKCPVFVHAGEQVLIKTGIATAIPDGYYGRVAPRSGLAVKHGIHVMAGVIDADYRGEIGVVLINLGFRFHDGKLVNGVPLEINHGDRIAQLIFERADRLRPIVVDALSATVRGAGGYGSTG